MSESALTITVVAAAALAVGSAVYSVVKIRKLFGQDRKNLKEFKKSVETGEIDNFCG